MLVIIITIVTIVIIVTIVCASILIAPFLLAPEDGEKPEITSKVERRCSTPDEMTAISNSEALDLPALTELARFRGYPHLFLNETPTDMEGTIYPDMVDRVALDHYLARLEVRRASGESVRAELEYVAEVDKVTGLGIPVDVTTLANFTVVAWYSNLTGLPVTGSGHILPSGYIIDQTFHYGEFYGPLAAWWGDVGQIVVLDAGGVVRVVLVSEAQHAIS